ncbi:hypothetical protein [Rubrivirga sp. IMCC43871]|uniref:hypothetical protein n=1 Tax=Rubrivirga sp. IMCC43871 TaxID=3391575 RepID=UPI00399021F8
MATAAAAYRAGAARANVRRRAVSVLLARRVVLGSAPVYVGSGITPPEDLSAHRPESFKAADVAKCEAIIELRDRKPSTPTQYADWIGARCVGASGERLGKRAVLNWLGRRHLFTGRGDTAPDVQRRAEAFAEAWMEDAQK